jgi:putative acetyltransferase
VKIRPAGHDDGEAIWRIHTAAVRVLCAGWYSCEQIGVWTGRLAPGSYRAALDRCEIVVAERDGEMVGFGQIDVMRAEIEAVYVLPDAIRSGVGSALLAHLEDVARGHGLQRLALCASLNAEAFYARRGYRARGRENHPLTTAMAVDCIRMDKVLAA